MKNLSVLKSLGGLVVACAPLVASTQPQVDMANEEQQERATFVRAAMQQQDEEIAAELRRLARRGVFPLLRVSRLTPFGDWDYYYVDDGSIEWTPNQGQTLERVDVPQGFVTDLTSVPRLFWQRLRPEGRYAFAAVVHDYLYWTQTRSREEADEILKLAMQDSRVGAVTVGAIYGAVRLLGQSAWDRNARLKADGEKRFLKVYPADFTIGWDDWKARPGVFSDDDAANEQRAPTLVFPPR